MNEQHFTAILKGKNTLDKELVERLYAHCDDASAGSKDGVGHVRFDRPANSLNEAIATAIADLKVCGLEVERIEIEPDDLPQTVPATA